MEEKKEKRITVDLPSDIHVRLKVFVAKSSLSMKNLIVNLLSSFLNEVEKK